MQQYKQDFIKFLVGSGALQFGSFVTKSGRNTPFFINCGCFNSGEQLLQLGEFYAAAINDSFKDVEFDVVFGPAYKGIPIAVATAMSLQADYGINVSYCSNRKEVKEHGDVGGLLGAKLKKGDRVLIVEDVTTAGTSVHETMQLLNSVGAKAVGLVVSVDRVERGKGIKSALKELELEYAIKTTAVVHMGEIIKLLYDNPIDGKIHITPEIKKALGVYYMQYGARNED